MNCLKVTQANKLCATAVEKSIPTVVDFSVHGIGISISQNKFFVFGL